MNLMKLTHLYDFYFLEALRASLSMAKCADSKLEFKHSFVRLESDVEAAFSELADIMAKRIRLYLFASALGEARHAKILTGKGIKGLAGNYSRENVYKNSTKYAISDENVSVLKEVFSAKGWGSAYGGKAWLGIVEAMDLYGKVSNATFIDHTVDLEHNGGTIFSKDTRETDVKFDPCYKINDFLDLKFGKDILTDGIEAEISGKVYRLLERHNTIISSVNFRYIKASLEWLQPYDVEQGREVLEIENKEPREETRDRSGQQCAMCGDEIDEEDHQHTPNDECICQYCYDDNYSYCEECDKVVDNNEVVRVDDDYMCEHCAKNKGAVQCEDCQEWTTEYMVAEDTSSAYCEDCASDNMSFCEICEFEIEDMQYHNEHEHGDVYCKHCQEIVDDMIEHNIENHYEPVELSEGEGFYNPINPIEPFPVIGLDSNHNNIYFHGFGLKIVRKNGDFVLFPEKMEVYFSHSRSPVQAFQILLKVKDMIDWKNLTMEDWIAIPETTKSLIKQAIGG